ncbi:MAG: DUF72 domain-containing protein [Burkholderiales bacterium]
MANQLSLFKGPPSVPGRGVGPAPVDGAVAALARDLPASVRLGTSSWAFPGWAGIVYDRPASETLLAREGLGAYARHPCLRAVGIDRTFYAAIPALDFARYAAQVPAQFRFVVKAPGLVTDAFLRADQGRPQAPNQRFLDARFAVEHFVRPAVEGLGDKCGPLLLQFPPLGRDATRWPARFAERLAAFLAGLPRGPLYAVEVRDRELLADSLVHALNATGARYCFSVHPRMPALAEQARRTADLAAGPLVARWNLRAGLEYEAAKAAYAPFDRLVDDDPATRDALARLAAGTVRAGHPVFVTANNKAEGSAPLTVFRLAGAIRDALAAP